MSVRAVLTAVLAVACFSACSDSSDSDGFKSNPDPLPTPIEEISTEVIRDFLWKPSSERNQLLVVLVNPVGARIEVHGVLSETLTDSGPSNGRGTTGRSAFAGHQFGDNVKVEFFDPQNRRIRVADGSDAVTVPRGAVRFEFRM